jgi:hypothetical protein
MNRQYLLDDRRCTCGLDAFRARLSTVAGEPGPSGLGEEERDRLETLTVMLECDEEAGNYWATEVKTEDLRWAIDRLTSPESGADRA